MSVQWLPLQLLWLRLGYGLLVYHVFEPKTKRYHVDVELTLPGGDGVFFSAPYRRRKAK